MAGRNAVIGTVSGYRAEYATFFVLADYSAIGATSLTFQLWNGGRSSLKARLHPERCASTESFHSPRANPWWRQTNGESRCVNELRYPVQVSLPSCNASSCPYNYGDRIFIRPNGATSVVEFVSRTDVFGGGGLPNFNFDEVRLGMFHRPHAALGDIKLVATNRVLTVAEIPPGSEAGGGVMAEFPAADSGQIQLLPMIWPMPGQMRRAWKSARAEPSFIPLATWARSPWPTATALSTFPPTCTSSLP